jgi:hypothetical protein
MASVHKTKKSKYWICAFTLINGKRTQRSTRTTKKKEAQWICQYWEDTARSLRNEEIQASNKRVFKQAAKVLKEVIRGNSEKRTR